ncbi:LemA family protein [Candidatus Peregrinibacteria bacterium]|nr:LemA family protein [Candidatus Peregrinibacteria bacterium]
MNQTLILIGSAAVFLALLWGSVVVRHRVFLKKIEMGKRLAVEELLRKKLDLIPNLIETFRRHDMSRNELVDRLIKARTEARIGLKDSEELNAALQKMLGLENEIESLKKDTNFLELKREIGEVDEKCREFR